MSNTEVEAKDMAQFGRIYNCPSCARKDCIHRGAYRRLPRSIGGLDLCPGHEKEGKEEGK